MKTLKHWFVVTFVSFFMAFFPAHSQIPTTDIANVISQGLQYAQQVQQYIRQGIQLQNELKNLASNPTSLLGPEVGSLINGVGDIMAAGKAIGGGMTQISANFKNNFKNNNSSSMTESFTRWNNTSTDTLEAAMKAAGLHRDSYPSDTDALTALYNESQASGGNLQAVQSLAKINAMQVQQMQKLNDLISTQNIAATTYMAAQTARQNALEVERDKYVIDGTSLPTIGTKPARAWGSVVAK